MAAVAIAAPAASQPASVAAPARSEAVFTAWDTDRNQALSREEFRVGYAKVQQAIALEVRLRTQFNLVDVDRSGVLEAGEFANLVLVKSLGAAAPSLTAFDANADRALDFAEYVGVVQKLGATTPAAPAAPAATP